MNVVFRKLANEVVRNFNNIIYLNVIKLKLKDMRRCCLSLNQSVESTGDNFRLEI